MPEEVAKGGRDVAIARLAAHQHGVLSVQQLKGLGLSTSAIGDRVTAGRLHRIHRGVYAVGHDALSNEGSWMAAVLACGDGAVLSHGDAAALWRMLRPHRAPAAGGRGEHSVDVTVPSGNGRARRPGIRVHRSSFLSTADLTCHNGIPVTKPARTLRDLRRVLPARQFAAAVRQAEFLRLSIGDAASSDRTRSELEARFLALLRRHRLPQPVVNVEVATYIVDFLWPIERLIAELDGWEAHGTRSAFEADRSRDAHLKVLGYEVVRFTWRQIESDSATVAATIRALLAPGT